MMSISAGSDNGAPVSCDCKVAGVAGYLDQFALYELSKPANADLRGRFISALQGCNGSLIFSVANIAEIALFQGASAANVRDFLNAFEHHWALVEFSPLTILQREPEKGRDAALSKEAIDVFFKARRNELEERGGLIDLSARTFFTLGAFVDWAATARDEVDRRRREMDAKIKQVVSHVRDVSDRGLLDQKFPPIGFNPVAPMSFVWTHLVRGFALDRGTTPKKGDGIDLCHAAIGAASASFVVVDKQWKARIEALPKPNGVAKAYYLPELSTLVSHLEEQAAHMRQIGG